MALPLLPPLRRCVSFNRAAAFLICFMQGEELLIDYGEGFWKTMYCGIMRAHTETYRLLMPWCGRMKQLIEDRGLDEPPHPDFSRSLPPLLMETMDVCCTFSDSHEEKFRVFACSILLHDFVNNFVFVDVLLCSTSSRRPLTSPWHRRGLTTRAPTMKMKRCLRTMRLTRKQALPKSLSRTAASAA